MTTLYVFSDGPWFPGSDDIIGLLVADSGEILGSHICSSEAWLMNDLVRRPDRQALLAARFPNGVEVIEGRPPDSLVLFTVPAVAPDAPGGGEEGRE